MLYDWTKAEAESEVLEAVKRGLDAVILSPTAVIGPYDFKPSAMGKLLIMLYHKKIHALVKGGFNWVDVRDVVSGALSAEKSGMKGERYLLGGIWCSLKELSSIVESISGQRAPRIVFPMWLARAGAPAMGMYAALTGKDPLYTPGSLHALRHHRHISCRKASAELGFRSRPLKETLRDTFTWFQSAGYITDPGILIRTRLPSKSSSIPSRNI